MRVSVKFIVISFTWSYSTWLGFFSGISALYEKRNEVVDLCSVVVILHYGFGFYTLVWETLSIEVKSVWTPFFISILVSSIKLLKINFVYVRFCLKLSLITLLPLFFDKLVPFFYYKYSKVLNISIKFLICNSWFMIHVWFMY